MIYIKILSVIALIASIIWLILSPGFESILALVGSLSTAVSVFLIEGKKAKEEIMPKHVQQRQSVDKSSIGIQAGRDIKIKDERGDKHVR